jgi:hypothetical protein
LKPAASQRAADSLHLNKAAITFFAQQLAREAAESNDSSTQRSSLQRFPGLELGCSNRAVDMVDGGVNCVERVGEPRASSLVARRVDGFS